MVNQFNKIVSITNFTSLNYWLPNLSTRWRYICWEIETCRGNPGHDYSPKRAAVSYQIQLYVCVSRPFIFIDKSRALKYLILNWNISSPWIISLWTQFGSCLLPLTFFRSPSQKVARHSQWGWRFTWWFDTLTYSNLHKKANIQNDGCLNMFLIYLYNLRSEWNKRTLCKQTITKYNHLRRKFTSKNSIVPWALSFARMFIARELFSPIRAPPVGLMIDMCKVSVSSGKRSLISGIATSLTACWSSNCSLTVLQAITRSVKISSITQMLACDV